MPTVLVTGGAGALAKSVIARLISLGYNAVGTRRCPGEGAHVIMDVTNPAQVASVIALIKPNLIIHLAATFDNDYGLAFSTNVVGAQNILSAVAATAQPIRVLLAGSAAEYGVVVADENPISEDRILRPVSVYGLTKSWQTNYGLMCAYNGQDVVIARIFNIEGPGMSERLFVGRINQQIMEVVSGLRKRIEVGPLSAVRDYISHGEAAEQLVCIAVRGASGKIYHVASGKPIQMRELLRQRLLENGLDFDIVDEAASLSSRIGYDVPVVYADMTRTNALMNEKTDDRN